jgi:orotate phosphoribosyltransferase
VFNRKEVKDHGEGGQLVGADLNGRILIVDDVITAGTAIHETMSIIDQSPGSAVGVLIAADRQERGKGPESAIQEIERTYGIQVISVVGFTEIIEYLEVNPVPEARFDRMKQYRDKYGVSSD